MEMTSKWMQSLGDNTATRKIRQKFRKSMRFKKSGDSYGDVTKALNVIIICFENYSNKYIWTSLFVN